MLNEKTSPDLEEEQTKPEDEALEDEKEEKTTSESDEEGDSTEEDDSTESEEESTEEDVEPKDKNQKSVEKLQRRLDKVTAKAMDRENELLQQIEEANEQLRFYQEEIAKEDKGVLKEELLKDLPLYTFNGKSIYALTDLEARAAIRQIRQTVDEEKIEEQITLITGNRAIYMERLKHLESQITKTEKEIWAHEWGLVETNLKSEVPELTQKQLQEMGVWVQKQIDEKPYLKAKLAQGGVKAKADLTVKAIFALGLHEKINKSVLKKPSLDAPLGSGKGHKSAAIPIGRASFTREQIARMSQSEYEKNEAAIDEAMRQGRIR